MMRRASTSMSPVHVFGEAEAYAFMVALLSCLFWLRYTERHDETDAMAPPSGLKSISSVILLVWESNAYDEHVVWQTNGRYLYLRLLAARMSYISQEPKDL